MIKIWLDDIRPPPDDTWKWVKKASEAKEWLRINIVGEISFDHDLGENVQTGYDVAKYIEYLAVVRKGYGRLKWSIHSANPVGRNNIRAAMLSCEKLWK